MKKNKRTPYVNNFFYFERKLLEEYLNDQAKEGYHLKFKNYNCKFEYNPDKHVYYHVDAIKTKKRYMGQINPDEQYLDIFENQGYHYIGRFKYFNVFESFKPNSIFEDDSEEDVVKDMFKKEFKNNMSMFIIDIVFGTLLIYIIFDGLTGGYNIQQLSGTGLFMGFALIFQLLGRITSVYIPLIRYKLTTTIDYTYYDIYRRGYIAAEFSGISCLIILASILCVNIRIILLISLMALVFILFSFRLLKNNTNQLAEVGQICFWMLLLLAIVFSNFNKAFVLQHEKIKYKEYSQRSSIMEFSWYALKDSEDCLYLLDIYEPLLTDHVLNDFIGDNEYVQDGDTYFVRDYVVVRKENRILKMEKDFYENHLNSLQW